MNADLRFDRPVVDTWPERVRTTVERLRAQLDKHPGDVFYRLALRGWEQELARTQRAGTDHRLIDRKDIEE